jgi:serine/threonine protein phosphatase PrpC
MPLGNTRVHLESEGNETRDKAWALCRQNQFNFYGVLDGHAGQRASEFTKNDLPSRLSRVTLTVIRNCLQL